MRFARIITAIVAFALLGLLPAAAAPANAAEPSARAAAKKIEVKIVKKKGKLILQGRVKPSQRYSVIVQKATKCNVKKGTCNFKFYKKVRSTKKGRYQTRVYAPTNGSWAWRAHIGKTNSDIWVTCKRRTSTSPCPTP